MDREPSPAERLLDKLAVLIAEELDDEERVWLAALLAPGIASAYDEQEVEGFGVAWSRTRLPDALRTAVRDRHLRIEGL